MKKFISKAMIAVMIATVLAPVPKVQAKTVDQIGEKVEFVEEKLTYDELVAALNAAKEDTAKKKAAMDEAKKKADNAAKKEAQGSMGFFSYCGCAQAVNILKDSWTLQSTQLAASNDATSFANLKATVPFLKECNSLRASEKTDPRTGAALGQLNVSLTLMAISEAQCNWSSNIIGHSQHWPVAENLAWGYSDPFAGWYNEEKQIWNSGNHNFSDTGHYLNMCSASYKVTGFAYNQRSNSYGRVHEQSFDYSSYGSNDVVMTVSQFESKLNSYVNSIKRLKDAYVTAKAEYETALAKEQQIQAQLDNAVFTYKITYKLYGGTNVADNPSTYTNKSKTIVFKPAIKPGYTFVGWYRDASYSATYPQIKAGSKGNRTIHAKWEKTVTGAVSGFFVRNVSPGVLKVGCRDTEGCTAYQIQYSKNADMSSGKTAISTKNRKEISVGKGTYYVRIRAFTLDSAGKRVYGKWTGKKTIVIK